MDTARYRKYTISHVVVPTMNCMYWRANVTVQNLSTNVLPWRLFTALFAEAMPPATFHDSSNNTTPFRVFIFGRIPSCKQNVFVIGLVICIVYSITKRYLLVCQADRLLVQHGTVQHSHLSKQGGKTSLVSWSSYTSQTWYIFKRYIWWPGDQKGTICSAYTIQQQPHFFAYNKPHVRSFGFVTLGYLPDERYGRRALV